MAAKLSITSLQEDEENGLKSRHGMFIAMVVYVVFQLSLLGSLLSSSHFRSACNTPHFYLSIAASFFTIITLLLAYVAEDMQEAAPPCCYGRREDMQEAAPPCCYERREDMQEAAPSCCYGKREDIQEAAPPCWYGRREDMQEAALSCYGRRGEEAALPCYVRRVGACFHVALYPLLVYALISMR